MALDIRSKSPSMISLWVWRCDYASKCALPRESLYCSAPSYLQSLISETFPKSDFERTLDVLRCINERFRS
jgi:hypothetical protein